MRRTIVLMTKVIIFTVFFLGAYYLSFSWESAGKFAVSIAHDTLQKRGMRLNYSDISGTDGGFTVNNLSVSGMTDITVSSITVKPEIMTSILTLSPVCRITFKGANVRMGMTMGFGDGGFLLTYGREIMLEDLRTDGEISVDGYMTIDTTTMKIGHAEAKLNIPESLSQGMGMMKNFLPIVQDGGTWYIRR